MGKGGWSKKRRGGGEVAKGRREGHDSCSTVCVCGWVWVPRRGEGRERREGGEYMGREGRGVLGDKGLCERTRKSSEFFIFLLFDINEDSRYCVIW